ncbi:hypothetical protein BLOT_009990 [Blomia tropicalis]|nr:hypothetical protein BLOT_009990 [Blomia tropicalis]
MKLVQTLKYVNNEKKKDKLYIYNYTSSSTLFIYRIFFCYITDIIDIINVCLFLNYGTLVLKEKYIKVDILVFFFFISKYKQLIFGSNDQNKE